MTIQELIDELNTLEDRDRVIYVQTKDDGLDFPEVVEGFIDLEDTDLEEKELHCVLLVPAHEAE